MPPLALTASISSNSGTLRGRRARRHARAAPPPRQRPRRRVVVEPVERQALGNAERQPAERDGFKRRKVLTGQHRIGFGAILDAVARSARSNPASCSTERRRSVGTRCRLGLNPTRPHKPAGTRTEPPVSVPMPMSHMPSATLTAAPDDEPPGTRARSRGLPGVPKCGLAPMPEKANSVMLVLATITAPAARSRRTTAASAVAGAAFLGKNFRAGAGRLRRRHRTNP